MDNATKIRDAINRVRKTYGASYPKNDAERKSLISWLHTDVCHDMVPQSEVKAIVKEVIGD